MLACRYGAFPLHELSQRDLKPNGIVFGPSRAYRRFGVVGCMAVLTEQSWASGAATDVLPLVAGQAIRVVGVAAMLYVGLPWILSASTRGRAALFASPAVVYATVAGARGLGSPTPLQATWESIEFLAIWIVAAASLKAGKTCADALFRGCLVGYSFSAAWVMLQGLFLPAASRTIAGAIPVQLQGVVPIVNPNQFGTMAAAGLVTVACFWRPRSRTLWVSGLAATLLAVALSQSRTVWLLIGALAMTMLFSRLNHYSVKNQVILGAALIAIPVASVSAGPTVMEAFVRGQDETSLLSLSGRTSIWAHAIASQSENGMIVGEGIGVTSRSLTTGDVAFAKQEAVLGSAHNGYVEAHLAAGLLGSFGYQVMILLAAAVGVRRIAISKALASPAAAMGLILAGFAIRNLTGSVLSAGSAELVLFASTLAAAVSSSSRWASPMGHAVSERRAAAPRRPRVA